MVGAGRVKGGRVMRIGIVKTSKEVVCISPDKEKTSPASNDAKSDSENNNIITLINDIVTLSGETVRF